MVNLTTPSLLVYLIKRMIWFFCLFQADKIYPFNILDAILSYPIERLREEILRNQSVCFIAVLPRLYTSLGGDDIHCSENEISSQNRKTFWLLAIYTIIISFLDIFILDTGCIDMKKISPDACFARDLCVLNKTIVTTVWAILEGRVTNMSYVI